jgi:hypothetical protein
MNDFTRSFAKEAAFRQIDNCTNIDELKNLAKMLAASHFQARDFIGKLILPSLHKDGTLRDSWSSSS